MNAVNRVPGKLIAAALLLAVADGCMTWLLMKNQETSRIMLRSITFLGGLALIAGIFVSSHLQLYCGWSAVAAALFLPALHIVDRSGLELRVGVVTTIVCAIAAYLLLLDPDIKKQRRALRSTEKPI
jgi:hypothetical protein